MRTNKLQYVFTWVSLILLLISSTLLVVSSWNSQMTDSFSPKLIVLLWVIICTSGIYLFMLAVKKAHRIWIDEKRHLESVEKTAKEKLSKRKDAHGGNKGLDYANAARKIVRRIPENIAEDQIGSLLLKNIAREIEIMSGVYYSEDKGEFRAAATYAMNSQSEPYTFKMGEGLSGQAARNQQQMVMTRLPEGHLEVYSGLGKAAPAYLAIVPLVHKGKTVALLECSGYRYEPADIENMFKVLSRELMDKRSLNL